MINSTTRPVPSRRSRPDSPLKNPTDFPKPISGSVQDDLMLAPNQPREWMWLHKKFSAPSYPRENPILGPGLNKDALTSRCVCLCPAGQNSGISNIKAAATGLRPGAAALIRSKSALRFPAPVPPRSQVVVSGPPSGPLV